MDRTAAEAAHHIQTVGMTLADMQAVDYMADMQETAGIVQVDRKVAAGMPLSAGCRMVVAGCHTVGAVDREAVDIAQAAHMADRHFLESLCSLVACFEASCLVANFANDCSLS